MKHVVALFVALVLNAAANLLMKIGTQPIQQSGGLLRDGFGGAIRQVLTSPWLVIGLLCFGLNAAFYMYALQSRMLKISLAYPIMTGGGFALIALAARFHPLLRERLNVPQLVGIALIFAGIILITTQMGAADA
ncbi:MAG: small multidrug resistance protein [Phycisphaerae bacterium]|nr:small multidrug resistance protein [Phycisphaerae bacterium]